MIRKANRKISKRFKKILIIFSFFCLLSITLTIKSKSNIDSRLKIISDAVKIIVNDPNKEFSVSNIIDANGIFQFDLILGNSLTGSKITAYITKNGKIILMNEVKVDANSNSREKLVSDAVKIALVNPNKKFSVSNIIETNGIYQFDLIIGNPETNNKFPAYISKNGKFLFMKGIIVDNYLNNKLNIEKQNQQKKESLCQNLDKTNNPKLTAFIFSQCEYGLQMQRVFKKTIETIKQIEPYLDVKYIVTIQDDKIIPTHGEIDVNENLKQICIREEYKDKYWPYLTCYMKEGKSDECSHTVEIDELQLKLCIEDKSRGFSYLKKDFAITNKFNIKLSPTLLLNYNQIINEYTFGGRNVNSIKEIICCTVENQPSYCATNYDNNDVALMFSKTDEKNWYQYR